MTRAEIVKEMDAIADKIGGPKSDGGFVLEGPLSEKMFGTKEDVAEFTRLYNRRAELEAILAAMPAK